MSAADLALTFVRTGAVLAVALLAMALARKSPALRVAAARWGLAGALLLALATPLLRERPRPLVPVTVPARTAFVVAAPLVAAPPEVPVAAGSAPVSVPARAPEPLDLVSLLPAAWAVGSGLLLLHLLAGLVALARMRRACAPVTDEGLLAQFERLAAEAGIRMPGVFEGTTVGGPCVAGALRAAVYLPTGWAATDADVVDAVLRHELAHVANGDLRWGLFARVARALLWPQPLAWLLRGPQAAAEEALCDRQALALGTSPARYAAGLLALREARRAGRVPSLAIGAASRRSGFGRRVEAILAFRGGEAARLSRRAGLAVRAGTLTLALAAAFAFARPIAATAQGADQYASWTKGPYAARVPLVEGKGAPVMGARAWLVLSDPLGEPKATPLKVEDGALVLPGGTAPEGSQGTLAVRVPGYALAIARLWPAPKRLERVTLVAPTSLAGRLLLPDGRPAAGLPVRATLLVDVAAPPDEATFLRADALEDPELRAITDADGRFRLGGLPPTTSVAYGVEDDRYAGLGFNDRATTGKMGEATAKPVTLRLAGRIEGRVVREGRPVAGLRIEAQTVNDEMMASGGAAGSAVTDADGRYAIRRLTPSVYNVAADLQGPLGEEVTTRAHERVRVEEGARLEGMDFELIPGTIVQGTVTGPDGKPVEKAYVGVYGPAHPDSGAWVQTVFTDAQGRYRLRVPAGAQRVYVADDRYQAEESRVTTTEGASTVVDFRVQPKAPEQDVPAQEAAESAAQSEEKPETSIGPTASFGPGKPFYGPVRLPNGATVRLTTVQDGTKGNPAWRPDGGPVSAAERKAALDMTGFGTNREGDPVRRIFLRVEVTGAARGDTYAVVQVPHPSNWNVWQTYGDSKGGSRDLASFRAHRTLRVTDMRFGLAAGPYRKAMAAKIGEGSLAARVRSGQGAPPETLVGEANVAVTVRFPAALEGQDVRLAAITKDGRELEVASWQNDTQIDRKTGERVRSYGFSGGSADEVGRVELRARPYRYATFRGIHLYPNER